MVSAKTKVINPQGLHMRPAIVFNGKPINAKSIMNLMASCIKQGSEIEIQCTGEQEAEALAAAVKLVETGLGDM